MYNPSSTGRVKESSTNRSIHYDYFMVYYLLRKILAKPISLFSELAILLYNSNNSYYYKLFIKSNQSNDEQTRIILAARKFRPYDPIRIGFFRKLDLHLNQFNEVDASARGRCSPVGEFLPFQTHNHCVRRVTKCGKGLILLPHTWGRG